MSQYGGLVWLVTSDVLNTDEEFYVFIIFAFPLAWYILVQPV